jgi:FkbM family methyltransferase
MLSFLMRRPLLYRAALRMKGTLTAELRVFTHLVRAGNTVFDIGANRGHFTVLFSRLVGRYGTVHAFEPVAPTYAKLCTRVAAEGASANTVLVPAAVSDQAGRFPIFLPGEDDGQASLATHETGSWHEANTTEYVCDAMTLDDYVRAHAVRRLDFVKCDVEGAELPALRGAAATLALWKPTLYVELNPDWVRAFGYTPRDLWDFLRGIGYAQIFHVSTADPLPVFLTETEFARIGGYSNLLCLSPQRMPCAF